MFDEIEGKNTRERVLQTLLLRERCTINDLAGAVDINPISVRHHISRLEAEGLVVSDEERHGVGRPHRMYFLTEKGRERFPSRYIRLTLRLLEQLKETMPPALIGQLFTQMARSVASDYQEELEGLSMEERLNHLTSLLSAEGFTVEWQKHGDEYHIRESNCPYYHVGQNYPEVCSVDQTLISTLLALPAHKVKCMLLGDNSCTYVVSNLVSMESGNS
jgi:DeoR family transcriptional regulator, suf operon transcriptional repressor